MHTSELVIPTVFDSNAHIVFSPYKQSQVTVQEPLQIQGDHSFNLFLPPAYMIGQTIAEGEFVTVSAGIHLRSMTPVAIKEFTHTNGDAILDQHILSEVGALKGVLHLELYETIVYGDRVFLIMEYCPYGDLREFINAQGPLNETHARLCMGDLVRRLQRLHRIHLIHRDLRLENVLIGSNG